MAATECARCGEPIEPLTIAGVTAWAHTDRPPEFEHRWEDQWCTGTKPRVRATPKETPVTPAKKPLLHRGRKPTARRRKRK